MENILFRKALASDIPLIHDLAIRIWRKHYPSIISTEQIEYMLANIYSAEALKKQLEEGNIFWLAYEGSTPLGYLSYSDKGNGDYFLQKFYVDADRHRKGIGKQLFDHVFDQLNDLKNIRLTVNRKNYTAINYYFKNGFVIEEVADFDIGEGYEMNDFVMLKKSKQ